MTSEEIRHNFDMRVAVPDGQNFIARYWDRSAAARSSLKAVRDVRYGPGPRQTLDVFPTTRRDAPIVMFWHGGAWRYQSKDHFSFLAGPLVDAGILTVLVGYDLPWSKN